MTVPTRGVLSNDRDADGDLLTAVRVNGPAHGALSLSRNGSFRYRPDRGFAGTDSFTYRATDGVAASAPANVTLRVRARPRCIGLKATLVGTAGGDSLWGTPRSDVIVALGGNDIIRGGGGNDVICAGGGDDVVHGQRGNDTLVGGPGRDRLIGGLGRDRIIDRQR